MNKVCTVVKYFLFLNMRYVSNLRVQLPSLAETICRLGCALDVQAKAAGRAITRSMPQRAGTVIFLQEQSSR